MVVNPALYCFSQILQIYAEFSVFFCGYQRNQRELFNSRKFVVRPFYGHIDQIKKLLVHLRGVF